MDIQNIILLEEKIAELMGTMRKLDDQKLKLESDINFLNKEKKILMGALDYYSEMERKIDKLSSINVQLESQLKAIMSALSKSENDIKEKESEFSD
jgi:predicted  nucleic acid-binding Zn-ribbon protein